MKFEFDGKRLTVTGKNLVTSMANGETIISESEPVAPGAAAPAATGAKRGRKSKTVAVESEPLGVERLLA